MEKIIITEKNRDGVKIWLEKVEDSIYEIKASKEYVLKYACENYDELPDDAENFDVEFTYLDGHKKKAHIISFDPSGGPYMSVGCKIKGNTLKRIFSKGTGTLFQLENNNK